MSELPIEPEAFSEQIGRILRDRLVNAEIVTSGPLELDIDGRPVDLENLYRFVRQNPDDSHDAIDQLVNEIVQAQNIEMIDLPIEAIATHVLPRICPFDFFKGRRSDEMAHQLFINDTVIIYTIHLNGTPCPIRTSQLIHWGITLEQLDQMARANLAAHNPDLELTVFHTDDGSVAALDTGDGFDASRLLLSRLHEQVAPELGGNFLVAIPARDVFVAFPKDSHHFIHRIRTRVRHDYRKLPYPITDDLFLVSADGISSWRPAA
jgi:hypothetical protein